MACQISLIIPSSLHPFIHPFIHSSLHPFIHSSLHPFIPSSIHPLILWSLLPLIDWFFVLRNERARIWGVARGAWPGQVLGSVPGVRPSNFVLKSLLFLIPFFFDFGSILGAKMTPKIHENPLKITFESALQLRRVFDPIFIDFSFDFRTPGAVKT